MVEVELVRFVVLFVYKLLSLVDTGTVAEELPILCNACDIISRLVTIAVEE